MIVAYASEEQQDDVTPGQTVNVRRRDGGRSAQAVVLSVAPAVQALPARTDPYGSAETWGLAVRMRVPDGMEVRPGESFRIGF
ncbi:MAG: hypothetical protein R3E97_22675 [Candidatus Eisenbacteria bacterium]